MLISDQYRALNNQLHRDRPDYGTSSKRWSSILEGIEGDPVLDYGCGKALLEIPGRTIRRYDPAIEEHSTPPEPAPLVVCTDVMEHIELDCLEDVLKDLHRVTQKLLFVSVATRPAKKTLADGRNAHLIVKPRSWWRTRFDRYFTLMSFAETPGEFVELLSPRSTN